MRKIFLPAAAISLSLGLIAPVSFAQTPAPSAPQTPPPAPAATAPTTAPEPAPPPAPPKAAPKKTKKKATAKKAPAKPPETAAPAEAASTYIPAPATVKQDRVNVRGRAALVGEVITQLHKGEAVTVLDEIAVQNPKANEPRAWAKIAMPANVPVWVSTSFLDSSTKAVKSARLNVRAGPGENFSIIGRLKQGDVVKEIRQVDNWTEIETPPGVFGFVAIDLLNKGDAIAAVTPPPAPEPKPEPVKTEVAKVEPAPVPPVPTPTPAPDPAVAPLVLPPPAPIEEKPVKRVVRREGIVRATVSIQAPTPYCLTDPYDNRMINYLLSSQEEVKLKQFKGAHIIVNGEEYVDPRWPRTPIIKIESLEVAP